MAASLMHKGQERHERIGLRMGTFLKRCGRDPETGQLLSLTGRRLETETNPIHLHAVELHKKRQHKRHQWTPKLPRHHDTPENNWHAKLQDDDADIVFEEFRVAVEASDPEQEKWYLPQDFHDHQKNGENHSNEVSPMSAAAGDDDNNNVNNQDSSPNRPSARILMDDDEEENYKAENDQNNNDTHHYHHVSPSPTSTRRGGSKNNNNNNNSSPRSMMNRSDSHKLLASVANSSSNNNNNNHHHSSTSNKTDNEYQQALEMNNLFLAQDATHHISYRNLRQDNRLHRVMTNQIVRGDGLDKITCGIPPEQRKLIRPGRVEIVISDEQNPNDNSKKMVVSRLVSQKQLTKEKLSHCVDFVAKYR